MKKILFLFAAGIISGCTKQEQVKPIVAQQGQREAKVAKKMVINPKRVNQLYRCFYTECRLRNFRT